MRVLRKAVQAAGRTVRDTPEDADRGTYESYARGHTAGKSESAVRSMPSTIRRKASRRNQEGQKDMQKAEIIGCALIGISTGIGTHSSIGEWLFRILIAMCGMVLLITD